jgi:hypothetical protein
MAWTIKDDLRLSIRMGLGKGFRLVRGLRRQLSEEERDRIADHLELANWKIVPGPPLTGHRTGIGTGIKKATTDN